MPSGSSPARRLPLLAGLCVVLVLLSGCLKLDADLMVSPDDTVTGTYVVAYKKDPKAAQPGFATARELLVTRGSADARKYDDGQYLGTEYQLRGVPFADLAAFTAVTVQGRQTGTIQLTRDGADVLVGGTFDFRESSSASRTPAQAAEARRLFSVRIRLSFPGEVQSANGAVAGRVVTWDIPPFTRTVLQARASAVPPAPLQTEPTGTSRYALYVGLGLFGVALLLGLVLLLRRLRRPDRPGRPAPVPDPAVPAEASDFAWVLGERRPATVPPAGWDAQAGRAGRTEWGRPPESGPPYGRPPGPDPHGQPPRYPPPRATGPWDRTVAGPPDPGNGAPGPFGPADRGSDRGPGAPVDRRPDAGFGRGRGALGGPPPGVRPADGPPPGARQPGRRRPEPPARGGR